MSQLYEALSAAIRAEEPVALATVVEGPDDLLGGKLVVQPGAPVPVLGSLGDPDLDRVVGRDALGELAADAVKQPHFAGTG